MTDLHAAFIARIQADADPRTAQLIYADWLEEQGDERCELLRLAVEIRSAAPPNQPMSGHVRRLFARAFSAPEWPWVGSWIYASRFPSENINGYWSEPSRVHYRNWLSEIERT